MPVDELMTRFEISVRFCVVEVIATAALPVAERNSNLLNVVLPVTLFRRMTSGFPAAGAMIVAGVANRYVLPTTGNAAPELPANLHEVPVFETITACEPFAGPDVNSMNRPFKSSVVNVCPESVNVMSPNVVPVTPVSVPVVVPVVGVKLASAAPSNVMFAAES